MTIGAFDFFFFFFLHISYWAGEDSTFGYGGSHVTIYT